MHLWCDVSCQISHVTQDTQQLEVLVCIVH